jgi:NhaP-type Na+/H+ or K+/H+ antiporter
MNYQMLYVLTGVIVVALALVYKKRVDGDNFKDVGGIISIVSGVFLWSVIVLGFLIMIPIKKTVQKQRQINRNVL